MEKINLCNAIYKLGKWPWVFLKTIMVPIAKKKNTKKCEEHRTISIICAKVLIRNLNKSLQKKVEGDIGKSSMALEG